MSGGTTSIYFGITYVCFIPRILRVFVMALKYQHRFFNVKISFEWQKQNLQKIPCWFTIWIGFVEQILIKLETSFICGFPQLLLWCPLGSYICKHGGGHSVSSEACTSFAAACVVWRSGSSLKLFALCYIHLKFHWHIDSDVWYLLFARSISKGARLQYLEISIGSIII